MSIASRITSMENNIRNAYHGLDSIGIDTSGTNKNIENISALLDDFYDTLPKVSGTGTNIQLTPTKKGRITSQINGDTFQQTYTGKNLFNKTDYTTITTGNNGNATNVKTTDKITITTGDTSASGIYITKANLISYITNYDSSQTYYVSMDLKANRSITIQMGCDTRPNFTIGTTLNRIYIGTKIDSNGLVIYSKEATTGDTIEITNIMISTSSDTTYEKYVGGTANPNPLYPQNIESVTGTQNINVCGKNLFNKNTIATGYINADGYVSAGATDYATSDFIKIDSTKTYSKTITNTPRVKLYDKNKNLITTNGYRDIENFNTAGTFTIPFENAEYIRFSTRVSVTESDIDKVMIVEDSTVPTTYEAYSGENYTIHLGNIELNKILNANVGDYITGTPNNWSIVNQIGNRIYNGSNTENWFVQNLTYRIANFDAKPFTSFDADNPLLYMNYFKWGNGVANNYKYGSCWYILNGTQLVVQKDETPTSTTLAEFKTWLGTHNLKAIYPLATPTTTPITDTTLINDLNTFYYAMSKNGETNISVVGNLPIILDVSALKGEE